MARDGRASASSSGPLTSFLFLLWGLPLMALWAPLAHADNLKVGVTLTFYWDYNFIITVIMAHLDLMKHFNSTIRERYGDPILELDNPHPNMSTVEVITRECVSNSVYCMAATQELISDYKVNAIAGDFVTVPCEATGGLAAPNKVPHISMCVGDTLGDRTRYPYTFRNSAPMTDVYDFMWEYMQYFKFRSAILLYTSDGFGTTLNNIKDYAQQEGSGSAILSLPLLGEVPFEDLTLQTIAESILESPTRLLILGCRSDAVDYVHQFLLDYNLTKPRYQILTSAASRNSEVFSKKFIGWHSVSAYMSDADGAVSKWFAMRAKMTQEDITSVLDKYGMSDWSPIPYVPSKLPSDEDFQTGLSELVEGFSLMAFNAVNTAFVAMNQLLNKGYDNDDIRGALLQAEILSLNVRGIGKNTSFDDNQDATVQMRLTQYTNVTLQFDTASATTILLPENEEMFHGTVDGSFPDEIVPILWPDDTYGTQPPKEYNQCHPGMYIEDSGACGECAEGSISSEFDTEECESCGLGTYSNDDNTECLNCTAGYIASEKGLSACTACPTGQYMPDVGASSCTLCPVGSYMSSTGATACIECESPLSTAQVGSTSISSCICPEGTYRDSEGSCIDCPEGITCAAGSQLAYIPTSAAEAATIDVDETPYPQVEEGYYTTYEDPLSVYECLEEEWCPGGTPESCTSHSSGISCGNCDEGYYRDVDGSCAECTSVMRTRGLMVALPTLAIPVIFRMAQDTTDVTKWYLAKNTAGPLVYITLFFVQSLAMYSTFSISLPSSTSALTASLAVSLDFRNLLRPECAEFHEYSANFLAGLAAPLYFAVIVVITWALSVVIARWWTEIRIRVCVALSFYGACYSTFFVSVANVTLNLFSCYPHPNGASSLRSAPHMLCYESDWSALVGVGCAGIFLYCVCFLALIVGAIWKAPQYYNFVTYRLATKFLFVRFRTGYAFWSVILLLKGLAVSLTAVMFTDAVSQFMWISLVLTIYVPATAALMPWRSTSVAFADVVTHVVLSYAFGLGGFFTATTNGEQQSVSDWLIVCVAVVGTTVLGVAAHSLYLKYQQDHKEDELTAKREAMTAALMVEMQRLVQNEAMLTYLFKVLPDWEVRNFVSIQKILCREARASISGIGTVSVSIGDDPEKVKAFSAASASTEYTPRGGASSGGPEEGKQLEVSDNREAKCVYV